MKASVLRLDELRAADAARTGAKAARLGELAAHGFPVPPGFVVTAEAYRDHFEGLGAAVDGLESGPPEQRARRCAELRRRIVDRALPPELASAILQAHAALRAERGEGLVCAVRSSATAEDLAGASFAGQHGTYYYVGSEDLLEMVRHCWASLWTPEAVAYRAAHGVPQAGVLMAVVVQEMVASAVSGVAFTAHPVSGEPGVIVVESSWGMGAAIVDGRVRPDRYVVEKADLRVRERLIAEKLFLVPVHPAAPGQMRLAEVPAALRRRETLSPEQIERVAAWALRCEEHFGPPQDVEWAIADGELHILQSRPVTTQRPGQDEPPVPGRWVLFKAIAENFTDPLTPLTADLLVGMFPPRLWRVIRGRLYMSVDALRPLVPLRVTADELARALYLSGGEGPTPPIAWARVPLALAAVAFGYLWLGTVMIRTRGLPDGFMEGFRRLCRRVEADGRLDAMDALRRLLLSPRPWQPIGELPLLVNLSALRFLLWIGLLRALLRLWLPGSPAGTLAVLCSGSEGVLSAEMGREVAGLAREAERTPEVRALLERHPPEEALDRLREEPAAQAFLGRLDAFLAVHGHRAVREFELRVPRWDEDPWPVLGMIRSQLRARPQAGEEAGGPVRARAELEAEIARRLAGRPLEGRLGIRRRLLRLAAGRAREYLKLRENSRFYHIMATSVIRRKVLAEERELLRRGGLRCREDIFFLRWHEVVALREGRLGWRDVEARIHERRLRHVREARLPPPPTIGVAAPPEPAAEGDGRLLRGQAASPGRYQGLARVILDPSVESGLRPGEVLVAPYTDPAWTPLFLAAGAAVVEVGSYLSHAGTVAREFGMPCLVDVAGCTRLIRTGDRVEVDAEQGWVRLLDSAEGA